MAQLNSSSQHESDTSVLSIILISASMLSFVITFLGIKFKWFRHRLTFDQTDTQAEGTPVLLRTTSGTEFRENCARGVYRRSEDAESLVFNDNPSKTNGHATTKTKSSDRHSIFRFPFKNKFHLTKFPSTEENQPSTTARPMSSASVLPTNRDQDWATFQKNENIRRMIHETLKSKNSSSMPDLTRERSIEAATHNERPLDRAEPLSRELALEIPDAQESVYQENKSSPVEEIVFDVVQKRVKFEEINEIEETIYEAQFENETGESSTDPLPMDTDDNHAADLTSKPSDRSRFDYDDGIEVDEEVPSRFEKVLYAPQTISVGEVRPDSIPPTPMKRKSREDSFNKKPVQAQPVERVEFNSQVTFAKVNSVPQKAEVPQQARVVEEDEPASQYSNVSSEIKEAFARTEQPKVGFPQNDEGDDLTSEKVSIELPTVKPRNKPPIERTLSVDEKISPQEVVTKADQEVTLSAALNSYDNLQKLKEKFAESSSSSSMEDESEEETVEHVEAKVVPKSILKTSETSGMQKSITFQNMPQSIRYHESSSSESEDEDVWSRMNQHRYNLTRNTDDRRDSPPPLPKTPPPSFEEEKQFSIA